MTKLGQNVTMFAGDTKTLSVTVYDVNDATIDISGSTIHWVLYKRSSGTIYLTKTELDGITLSDPTNGVFEISLDTLDTASLLGDYGHECELTDSLGNKSTIFTGYFKIIKSLAN